MLVANPAFADEAIQRKFSPNAYHGTVVWSWQQALVAAGLARQLERRDLPANVRTALARAQSCLWDGIEATRAVQSSELWSWRYADGRYQVLPFGAAGADVDDIERREKRVNLLPAVARDCLQGACQMSEVSRARWARIDATTKNAPDLTACLMAGTRRDEATRECGGGHARSYARRSRWRAPMHG